jgi:hypothetical protein
MERNKWEIAIRCLEVALHLNTGDDETIAAVNGFRRVAGGTPLTAICAALDGQQSLPRWRERLARQTRTNRDLAARLEAAARQIAALEAETLAAQVRVDDAEEQFTELRAAYAALAEQRHEPSPPIAPARAPFHEMLAAALGQGTAAPPSASFARVPWRA